MVLEKIKGPVHMSEGGHQLWKRPPPPPTYNLSYNPKLKRWGYSDIHGGGTYQD